MTKTLLLLPGDGIGPEVTTVARRVAGRLISGGLDLAITEARLGGAAIDADGVPLTAETLALAKASDAVLMGAGRYRRAYARPRCRNHHRFRHRVQRRLRDGRLGVHLGTARNRDHRARRAENRVHGIRRHGPDARHPRRRQRAFGLIEQRVIQA